MPGLTDLSRQDVENVFSYTLQKITTDELLDAFKETFKQLYDVREYEGGWQTNAINAAVKDYIAKTDAIKEDYRAKKITHITASSVTVVGGVLSFTPSELIYKQKLKQLVVSPSGESTSYKSLPRSPQSTTHNPYSVGENDSTTRRFARQSSALASAQKFSMFVQ
jgi:hypothetical protein